jgi:hypothetical protein
LKTLILIICLSHTAFSLNGGIAFEIFNFCNTYYRDGKFIEANSKWCNTKISNELYELLAFDQEKNKWCPDYQSDRSWKIDFIVNYRDDKTVKDVLRRVLNLKHKCK